MHIDHVDHQYVLINKKIDSILNLFPNFTRLILFKTNFWRLIYIQKELNVFSSSHFCPTELYTWSWDHVRFNDKHCSKTSNLLLLTNKTIIKWVPLDESESEQLAKESSHRTLVFKNTKNCNTHRQNECNWNMENHRSSYWQRNKNKKNWVDFAA